jgi:hypothetical protein
MELEVQKLLREHGLNYVKDLLKLEVKERGDLVLLKYNMLAADWSKTALYDCRGIILDRADDWNVVAYPYVKFFNLSEGYCAKIDWESARIVEKKDGSLTNLYNYKGVWYVQTSGNIYANQYGNSSEFTFGELFWISVKEMYGSKEEFLSRLNPNYNYMFELCTAYNIVVCQHTKSEIWLHGVRDMTTWKELHIDKFDLYKVKSYNFMDIEQMKATFDNMTWQDEGYVIYDKHFNRAKLKNPKYCKIHHLKGGLSPYSIIDIIKTNEIAEFCVYFKEREEFIKLLKSRWDALEGRLYFEWTNILSCGDFPTQKEFAVEVLEEIKKPFQGMMFALKAGKIKAVREGMCDLDNKFLYYYLQEN